MTPSDFQKLTGVSRETLERLEIYDALLKKWQRKINLVGPKTLPDSWERHFLDSAQLYPLLPENCHTLVDLGSGAGFPGIVLAIMGVPDVHVVESDGRKCAFMREVTRQTKAPVTVHNKRIEAVENLKADVVTSRALASLNDLATYAIPFLKTESVCIFPKGKRIDEELTEANYSWHIKERRVPSQTDPDGAILLIEGISDVRETTRDDSNTE